MKNKKDKVVIIWSNSFPFKYSASNEKNFLMAKSLMACNIDVVLTSKLPFSSTHECQGEFESVKYINFSTNKIKNKSLNYLNANFREIKYLIKLKKEYKKVFVFGAFIQFPLYFIYALSCFSFNIKLIMQIMEWHIALYQKQSISKRINAFCFDKFASYLSKGVIVISEFLEKKIKKQKNTKKILFIPALADKNKIDSISLNNKFINDYILYCGGIGYIEVINIILESFILCKENINKKLILILHGDKNKIENLQLEIDKIIKDKSVILISDLTYESLIKYYKNADILLIPLRNTVQDIARYPQKIAEYASCGRPIISNAVGQVAIDFQHKKDIFFAENYSAQSISKAIVEVINNKEIYENIVKNVDIKAENYFNCYVYSEKLNEFLNSI